MTAPIEIKSVSNTCRCGKQKVEVSQNINPDFTEDLLFCRDGGIRLRRDRRAKPAVVKFSGIAAGAMSVLQRSFFNRLRGWKRRLLRLALGTPRSCAGRHLSVPCTPGRLSACAWPAG